MSGIRGSFLLMILFEMELCSCSPYSPILWPWVWVSTSDLLRQIGPLPLRLAVRSFSYRRVQSDKNPFHIVQESPGVNSPL